MGGESKTWGTYEQVAAYLLNEIPLNFGLEKFEGKQRVEVRSAPRDNLINDLASRI
jgi:hypothetical protein